MRSDRNGSNNAAAGASALDELPIRPQFRQRGSDLACPLVHRREVVARVGEPGGEVDRGRVCLNGGAVVAKVVVCNADVEHRRRIARIEDPCPFVALEGLKDGTCRVQEPPEVHVCFGERRIDGDRTTVRLLRCRGVGLLQPVTVPKPLRRRVTRRIIGRHRNDNRRCDRDLLSIEGHHDLSRLGFEGAGVRVGDDTSAVHIQPDALGVDLTASAGSDLPHRCANAVHLRTTLHEIRNFPNDGHVSKREEVPTPFTTYRMDDVIRDEQPDLAWCQSDER